MALTAGVHGVFSPPHLPFPSLASCSVKFQVELLKFTFSWNTFAICSWVIPVRQERGE